MENSWGQPPHVSWQQTMVPFYSRPEEIGGEEGGIRPCNKDAVYSPSARPPTLTLSQDTGCSSWEWSKTGVLPQDTNTLCFPLAM